MQLDLSGVSLHRGEIAVGEYEMAGITRPDPAEPDDRPRVTLPIRYVTAEELDRLSLYPR